MGRLGASAKSRGRSHTPDDAPDQKRARLPEPDSFVVRLLIARGADLGVRTIQTMKIPGRPHSVQEIGREDSPPAPVGATPREAAIAVSRNAAARDAALAVYDDAFAQRVA